MISAKAQVTNNFAAIFSQLKEKAQDVCNETADAVSLQVESDVAEHGGSEDGYERTGGSTASIYLNLGGESNYAAISEAFRSTFEDFGSAMGGGRFAEVLLPELPLTEQPGAVRAMVASCSKIVWWWETGHHNRRTRLFEYDPVFVLIPHRVAGEFVRRFAGLLHRTVPSAVSMSQGHVSGKSAGLESSRGSKLNLGQRGVHGAAFSRSRGRFWPARGQK